MYPVKAKLQKQNVNSFEQFLISSRKQSWFYDILFCVGTTRSSKSYGLPNEHESTQFALRDIHVFMPAFP